MHAHPLLTAALAAPLLLLASGALRTTPDASLSPRATPNAPESVAPGARELDAALYPEPMEPLALRAALLDQPANYSVLDLRSAEAFLEYHVPHARRVEFAELAAVVAALPTSARIVLVDRDGTQAWAAAGALHVRLGDAAPVLRVLAGGTARYWREAEVGARAANAPNAKPAPAAPPDSTHPAPTKPRSAGC